MANRQIEEAIDSALKGDARKNAAEFVSYLRSKGVPFEEAETYWEVKEAGRCLCYLWIDGSENAPGPWTIWSDQEEGAWAAWTDGGRGSGDGEVSEDERTKTTAWAHVNVCGDCGGCQSRGRRKWVLGKAFEKLCNSTLAFTDPDAEAIDCAKRMVDARRRDLGAVENATP